MFYKFYLSTEKFLYGFYDYLSSMFKSIHFHYLNLDTIGIVFYFIIRIFSSNFPYSFKLIMKKEKKTIYSHTHVRARKLKMDIKHNEKFQLEDVKYFVG